MGERDAKMRPVDIPETRYAKTVDGVHVAYQVTGSGPLDLVLLPGTVTHVEYQREEPLVGRFLDRLASFSRLIVFDMQGEGLSDRATDLPTLERQMDDVGAVLDAAVSERAALFGISQSGPLAMLFAATYPQRASALVLYAAPARFTRAEGYPWGRDPESVEMILRLVHEAWGEGRFALLVAPSMAGNEAFVHWFARLERLSNSPGSALAALRMLFDVDVRHVLPSIRVPTLVLQRAGDTHRDPGNSRFVAEQIPGAKYVELPGVDHLAYVGDADAILDEIEDFLTGVRHGPEPDRVLATVLFTDIVGSTKKAAELGDRAWRDLLHRHNQVVRGMLGRHRGREVDTAGDGFLATFDGPARAVRCAQAIAEAMKPIGLRIRAGCHTGEVELEGEKVRGLAVHIGARVAAMAGPGEVLVSSTVKDLVAGSGLSFEDAGEHELKGIPDRWHLYRVVSGEA
jgi:class 3 adenylate cyclase